MKKLLVLVAAMAFVALGAGVATAGQYHFSTQLICSDCHTMHYSYAHDYSGGAAANMVLGAGGPFGALLRDQENKLCLACHDNQSTAPDVYGTNTGSHVRQAGALNGTGSMASPGTGYSEFMGHTLGSTAVVPGGTWTPSAEGLTCGDCHAVHGSRGNAPDVFGTTGITDTYRNLSNRRGGVASGSYLAVSYAKGTNDLTKDVYLTGWTLGNIAGNYSEATVNFNEPVTTKSGMGQWCMGCHTNFHGSSTDANMNNGSDFIRHPTADANISQSATSRFSTVLYRVKVMSATGAWGTPGTALGVNTLNQTPTCVSCHKSHGNKNPFGLIYLTGTNAPTEEGDGVAVRDLCRQCHSQGA